MEPSSPRWSTRPKPTGFVGRLLLLAVTVGMLVFLAVTAVLGLLAMALVGVVVGAERLLGLLVPAYRRRRRAPHLSVPPGLIRVVRLGSRPVRTIEARSYELPHDPRRR